MKIIEIWTDKGNKLYAIYFYPKHWKIFGKHLNGAKKGVDNCLDWSFSILGIKFNYVDFNYNNR